MLISSLDGRAIEVRRRWLPWKPQPRETDAGFVNVMDAADDPVSFLALFALSIVLTVVAAVVLTFALFASEVLLLLVLIIPLLGLARIFWLLPWVVEATYGDEVLGTARVRGWRDSEQRIHDIAAAFQRGEDPFATTPS